MLNASASGITARTVLASFSTSAALRGTSSTEILIGALEPPHLNCNEERGYFSRKRQLASPLYMDQQRTRWACGNE